MCLLCCVECDRCSGKWFGWATRLVGGWMTSGLVSLRSYGDEVEEADSGRANTRARRLSVGECWCSVIARMCASCWERVTSPLVCDKKSRGPVPQGSVSLCEELWADVAREQRSPSERWSPPCCKRWILHVPLWCADRCLCCGLWREPERVASSACALQRHVLKQRAGWPNGSCVAGSVCLVRGYAQTRWARVVDCLKVDDQMVTKFNQPTKGLTRGGDLRFAQVDFPPSV